MRRCCIHLFILLGLSISSLATDHYICQQATGSANGSSWTNACTDFRGNCAPSGMVRGDTYWVAAGSYSSSGVTFAAQDSGTSAITINAATDSAHGSSSTGWTTGGIGACAQGQAVFGPLQFQSDYWTFNGVYRGNATGNPWLDWRTNYGFKVKNNNGSHVPVNQIGAIVIGIGGNNQPQNGVHIEYTEVQGSGDITGNYTDMGIQFTGGSSTGNYAGYNYVHDVGVADGIDGDSVNSFTLEYNWVQNNEVTAAKHSEILAIRCWNSGTNQNLNIRYNFVENSNSTAMIATPCVNDIRPSNWAIYGNVFLYNGSEQQPGYSCNNSPTECGNGDGWLSLWNFSTWTGYLYVFNNTISSIDQPGGSCHHDWGGSTGQTMGTVLFYNNVYYHCQENIAPMKCPGSCSQYVDDYNSYFDMNESNDTGAHVQVSQTNPFTLVAQLLNQDNFALTTDTTAWFNTSSLLPGNNTDLAGNTRTSSRGALQYGSSTNTAPNPPTGLKATVN
jgi:hypothetical protein